MSAALYIKTFDDTDFAGAARRPSPVTPLPRLWSLRARGADARARDAARQPEAVHTGAAVSSPTSRVFRPPLTLTRSRAALEPSEV